MTVTVGAGNLPKKRQLRDPRQQARYLAKRLRGGVHSFSVCEMGDGLRLRLRRNPALRVVAPRANAIVRRGRVTVNRIGNGLVSPRAAVKVIDRGWIRFPDYDDRYVERGLFWPVSLYMVRETGEVYAHCSAHLPTRTRASDYERGQMVIKARKALERLDCPVILSGDFNWSPREVGPRLGKDWSLAAQTDVLAIWVRRARCVGRSVDTTVHGELTDHSGVLYCDLELDAVGQGQRRLDLR